MGDKFNLKDNNGQINIAKDNSTINTEQNKGSKYNISGGISGAIGDNATGTVTVNDSTQNSELEKIKVLVLELIKKIPEDNSIEDKDKEKMQQAINTTGKQLENDDKDMLAVCVNHPSTADSYNNLTALYDNQGKYEEAEHLCVTMRGIKKAGSKTITSAVRGAIRKNSETRNEVMSLINSK